MPVRDPLPGQPAPQKDERLELRLPAELAQQVREKALRRGWTVGSVMRALLARWVEQELITPEEVGQHMVSAPHKPRKRKKPRKRA